jgi:hypothetical protein
MRDRPDYMPSPEEIETLKRKIRAENDAIKLAEGSHAHVMEYREPRVGRTQYSSGDLRKVTRNR